MRKPQYWYPYFHIYSLFWGSDSGLQIILNPKYPGCNEIRFWYSNTIRTGWNGRKHSPAGFYFTRRKPFVEGSDD